MTRESEGTAWRAAARAAFLLAAGALAAWAAGRALPARGPVLEADIGPLAIKGRVLPMMGETLPHPVHFPRPVWLKGLSLRLLDERKALSEQRGMLCHATFVRFERGRSPKAFVNFQDGYNELRLPRGYAVPLEAGTYHLLSMLQSESEDTDRSFYFRSAVDAVPREAEPDLRPLRTVNVGMDGSALGLRPILPEMLHTDGKGCSHWWVPPGVHSFETTFTVPQDGSLKYANFHLHAYAREVRLSEGAQTLYVGRVETDAAGDIVRLPFYSSEEGLPLAAGRRYRYTVTYDNRRGRPVSGMAGMILFIHPAEKGQPASR